MIRFAVVGLFTLTGVFPAAAKTKLTPKTNRPNKAQIEAATRLQVFLDRANFSPGRIDGRYNDSTWKALALYRESQGEQPQAPPSQSGPHANVSPDVSGLDLGSVGPVFVPYTVTEADLQTVGPLPSHVTEQAKLKFLPYRVMLPTQFRKNFTSTFTALKQLNPGKLKGLKAGDQLKVPNVQLFELASVKDIQPASETALQAANEVEDQPETQASTPAANGAPRNVSAKVDTKQRRCSSMANAVVISTCSHPGRGIRWA